MQFFYLLCCHNSIVINLDFRIKIYPLHSTTDALDNTTKYSYNGLGKVVNTLVPFTKDASGNIVYSITENTYDKNGNVVLVKQTVNEQSAATAYSYTANTYDAQGRLI